MKNLNELFDGDIIDFRDVVEAIIILANNYLNSAKIGTKDEKQCVADTIKKFDLAKFREEKKEFIAGMKHYANAKDLQKTFRENCAEKLSWEERTDEDLAKVLEWIDSNFSGWEEFKKSADNEPTGISEYYFQEYAEELARDCGYIDGDKNPLMNYIDWEAWAEAVMNDYREISNPFHNRVFYVRSY